MTDELHPDDAPLPIAQAIAAAEYHQPPDAVPREAMWQAIQARRADAARSAATPAPGAVDAPPVMVTHTTRSALGRLPRRFAAVAVAAAAVISFGIARRTPVEPAPASVAADTAETPAAWQVASTEHFGSAESMLTALSYPARSEADAQLSAWSRDLLASTRLLMDSPAGRDPKRRVLLQDLELVLVQLVESGPTVRTEQSVMDELLTRSALLLTRIRTTVPAGGPVSHNQDAETNK